MGMVSTPQILRPARSAPLVWCRGWPWTPLGLVSGPNVDHLRVAARAADAPDIGSFLLPFDQVRPAAALRWRRGRGDGVRRWVAGWPNPAFPAATLPAAVTLPIDILPHQLVPALTLAGGRATRLLLADPVGLGKTVEAGLIVGELAARGAAARVLVLTPASLRDQWQADLRDRCRVYAGVVDRQAFERSRRDVPPGLPIYRPPGTHIMSFDLAKQPDVLGALTAVVWDAVIVDEAHLVAGDSARTAAARAIAALARVVLLLSATPHSGDPAAFRRLCSIGRLGDEPIAMIRAERPLDSRRPPVIRDVVLTSTPPERAARRRLAQYLRLLDRSGAASARLIGIVLRKRALSSPAALAASLSHRLAWLQGHGSTGTQTRLPFDETELDGGDVVQPAVLRDALVLVEDERTTLGAALDAAEDAVGASSKARALARLLRRSRERAIVFTEYRDTLHMLERQLSGHARIVVLHGGLDRGARLAALARFESGDARLLIATDVAAEGLNLQRSCRLVIHVELPWSPARLLQRNGRVDRLGQSRQVHVWRLLGDRRHESRVLAALAARAARIAGAGFDGSDARGEIVAAAAPAVVRPGDGPAERDVCVAVEAGAESIVAATETLWLRGLIAATTTARAAAGNHRARLPWWRLRHRLDGIAPGVIIAVLCPSAPGVRGALRFVHLALHAWPPGPPTGWLPRLADIAVAAVPRSDAHLAAALAARERALLRAAEIEHSRTLGRWQASLFEQRAAQAVAAARADSADRLGEHARRLAELEWPDMAPVAMAAFLVR